MSRSADDELIVRMVAAREHHDSAFLIDALKTERFTVAAMFLAQMGARSAIPQLLRLLDSANPWRRVSGARALGALKATEAVDRLLEHAHSDEERQMRLWSITALGQIGSPTMLTDLGEFLEDSDPTVRAVAAKALGRLGDPQAIVMLERSSRKQPWYRRRPYREALRMLRGNARRHRFGRWLWPPLRRLVAGGVGVAVGGLLFSSDAARLASILLALALAEALTRFLASVEGLRGYEER